MAGDDLDQAMTEPARPADDAVPHLWPAELDADYELMGELGRGGMAVVFRARDRDLGREVAVKVVRPRFAADEEAVARLAREARTVAQLEHPNIVGVYSIRHLSDRSVALVMQLIPGQTLKQAVTGGGPFDAAAAEQVLRDIARALAYAHRAGVVHRDVKPENIFLDAASGRAMLSDFGVARVMDAPTELTATGTTIGTPTYMAPEQIDGVQLDGRSDLYSLGMVGWEMLTGERPWSGESLYSVIYRQKHDQLTPIDAFRDDIPPRLQYLIEGLMPKNPDRRWASAARFLTLLGSDQALPGFKEWESAQRRRRRTRVFQQARERGDSVIEAALETVKFARPPTPLGGVPAQDPARRTPLAQPVVEAGESSPPATSETAPLTVRPTPARIPTMRPTPAARRGTGATPSGGFSVQRPAHQANTPFTYGVNAIPDRPRSRFLRAAAVTLLVAGASVLAWVQFGPEAREPAKMIGLPDVTRDDRAIDVPVIPATDSAAFVAADSAARVAASADPAAGGAAIADSGRLAATTPPVATRTTPRGDSLLAGRGTLPVSPPPVVPAVVPPPVPTLNFPSDLARIGAGGSHTCALAADGRAACWGNNIDGQLGDGTANGNLSPEVIQGDFTFSQISAGQNHSCGLTTGNEVVCWGANGSGQLGDGTTQSRTAPVRLNSAVSFRLVRAGRDHTCGLSSARTVWCWGSNAEGQLGDGTRQARTSPVTVEVPGGSVAALTVGRSHTCAITSDGSAYCWGANDYGQLGDGTTTSRPSPVRVRADAPLVSIAAGTWHSCAVTSTGDAVCWGRSQYGQLGAGTLTDSPTPRTVSGATPFTAIVAGSTFSCARGRDGTAWCWGRNFYGQLGDGTTVDKTVPVPVRVVQRVAGLNAGAAHACATTETGAAYCWGFNVDGQIGRGDRESASSPVRILLPAR